MTEFPQSIVLCIDAGEIESLPAEWSADDGSNIVHLDRVKLGNLWISGAMFMDIVGPAECARQVEFVQVWWCEEGLVQADPDRMLEDRIAAQREDA